LLTVQVRDNAQGKWRDVNWTADSNEAVYCAGLLMAGECPGNETPRQFGYPCLGRARGYCAGAKSRQDHTPQRRQSARRQPFGVRIIDATGKAIWLCDLPSGTRTA
jgi:hypothetical protein